MYLLFQNIVVLALEYQYVKHLDFEINIGVLYLLSVSHFKSVH